MLAVNMNKLMIKKYYLFTTLSIVTGCSQNQANNNVGKTSTKQNNSIEKPSTTQNFKDTLSIERIDAGKQWLERLFECKNANKYCFYLETEEEVCTQRFYQFMVDSEERFGASNLSEQEYPDAVKKYKEKWSKTYPLRTETEPWLFGRGQDDMENIIDVKVSKIADLNYLVVVDFNDKYKTKSKVMLVKNDNKFKIDYCQTTFLKP